MLSNKSKLLAIVVGLTVISTASLFAQSDKSCCSGKDGKKECCKTGTVDASALQDTTHSNKMQDVQMHSSTKEMKSQIVHEGEIDLAAIDANEDGKVFQDQMCWNVISDEGGECPQCGMTLKEVTLESARKNLEKFGHKVK